ncbi:MAG: TAXI family TRAP transporter solute-binding subunit [Alphaproteobacteria bacterium]|nr:TAXI family TRAP transporter solute-binding subunit [Alphaproteobacteria bacterium]
MILEVHRGSAMATRRVANANPPIAGTGRGGKRLVAALAAFVALAGLASPAGAQDRVLVLGTGGVTGVYYPAGGAVCRLLAKDRRTHGIRCLVENSGGSVENLVALRAGEIDAAIVQADTQADAVAAAGPFTGRGPDGALRFVAGLHEEALTILARIDSGIVALADLRAKRVNLGNLGAGQRPMMDRLLAVLGWTVADLAVADTVPWAEQARALCAGRFEAMVFTVGHPNGSVREAATTCATVLVPVAGPIAQRLLTDHPIYHRATVAAGLYPGIDQATATIGVRATLVASARVPEETIYRLMKAVLDGFDEFREAHAALAGLDRRAMTSAGATAPLHAGALRAYREAGLR